MGVKPKQLHQMADSTNPSFGGCVIQWCYFWVIPKITGGFRVIAPFTSKVKACTKPTEEPSTSAQPSKKDEDIEYIVEDDDAEDDGDDDGNDDDDVVDEDELQYLKK